MVDQLNGFAGEVTRGGPLGGAPKADWRPSQCSWRGLYMEGPYRLGELDGPETLTRPVRNIAEVTTAVALR